jgi:hypothetical protein
LPGLNSSSPNDEGRRKPLAVGYRAAHSSVMGLPSQVVSLSPEEVAELHRGLSEMRHSINNHLTLMVTAFELMRRKPESAERMVANLIDQPSKIREDVTRFSADLERTLHITAD